MDIRLYSYLIILLSGLFFVIRSQTHKTYNARKKYIVFICILLGLQSGLRGMGVGPDTPGYFNWYNDIKLLNWTELANNFTKAYTYNQDKDAGFPIFVKIIQMTGADFQAFLIVIAVIYFSALGIFLYRNTENVRDITLAFVLYVALFQIIGLSGIRQQVTTAIAFLSLPLIKKRKLLLFSILIIMGSTIHLSLLLMFLLYFFTLASTRGVRFLYYLPIVFFSFLISGGKTIATVLANLTQNDYYLGYIYSGKGGGLTYVSTAFLVTTLGIFNMKKIIHLSENYRIYYIAIFLMITFVPLILVDGTLIRIGQYFSLYMMVFMPVVLNHLKIDNFTRNTMYTLIMSFLIFMSLRIPFEYEFFWQ